jgi:hypothetical protein
VVSVVAIEELEINAESDSRIIREAMEVAERTPESDMMRGRSNPSSIHPFADSEKNPR